MAVSSLRSYNSSDRPDIIQTINHAKSNKLEISNTSFHYKFKDLELVHFNIFDDYKDILLSVCREYTLPENMFYKPEHVSFSVYGTVDLWYIILLVNNMSSFYDFNQSVIKLIPMNEINIINDIIEKNKKRLTENNANPQILEDITYKKI